MTTVRCESEAITSAGACQATAHFKESRTSTYSCLDPLLIQISWCSSHCVCCCAVTPEDQSAPVTTVRCESEEITSAGAWKATAHYKESRTSILETEAEPGESLKSGVSKIEVRRLLVVAECHSASDAATAAALLHFLAASCSRAHPAVSSV